MSAFVVSKAHIDYLIESGLRLGFMDRSPLRWNDPAAVPKWVEGGENANYLDRWRDASRVLDESTADRVGRMLLAENVRSVRYRYPDDRVEDLPGVIAEVAHAEEPDWYVFTRHDWNRPRLDPVQTLKALRCYQVPDVRDPRLGGDRGVGVLRRAEDRGDRGFARVRGSGLGDHGARGGAGMSATGDGKAVGLCPTCGLKIEVDSAVPGARASVEAALRTALENHGKTHAGGTEK